MKKYIYLLVIALLAVQFQSCSNDDDDDSADINLSDMMLDIIGKTTRAYIDEQIKGGGHDKAPVEGQPFYKEYMPKVKMVSALGTFAAKDQDGNIEMRSNLGGAVQAKDGGKFYVTQNGKSMHIVGSGTTHPQSGFTYWTQLSLTIDDTSLMETGGATITDFYLSMHTDITMWGQRATGSARMAATNVPMTSGGISYTNWKGGGITEYSWSSEDSGLTLVDNSANFIEIWITFIDGSSVRARAHF